MSTLFEIAGGEPKIRAVVTSFYDVIFQDAMIGFFFRGLDKQHLIDKEVELASQLLGAPVKYTGRSIRQAHAKHPIMGGQFDRRLQILKEAMAEHALPAEVQASWVEHTERMRHLVTGDATAECDDEAATTRVKKMMIFNQGSED